MKKIMWLMASIALCLAAMAAMNFAYRRPLAVGAVEDQLQMMNGAYRDGLYLGSLAARQGDESHVPNGRWSRKADREEFIAGYRAGYKVRKEVRVEVESALEGSNQSPKD